MNSAFAKVAPLLALLLTLSACADSPPCETGADCPDLYRCERGVCSFIVKASETKGEPGSSGEALGEADASSEKHPDGSPTTPDQKEPKPPTRIRLTRIDGDGSQAPVSFGENPRPHDAKASEWRFRTHWILHGRELDKLTGIRLTKKQQPSLQFAARDGLVLKKGTSTMRVLKLPPTLVTGLFLIVGITGTTNVALGEVFVLQGERGTPGSPGERGDAGADGRDGKDGKDGSDGQSCAIAQTSTFSNGDLRLEFRCGGTSRVLRIPAGKNGRDGARGPQGPAGAQGEAGPKGEKGDAGAGFSAAATGYLSTLRSVLKLNATKKSATFTGVNLFLQNGTGVTTKTNGLGNLIVGYNNSHQGIATTGSHNLVLGDKHSYSSYGGLVAGYNNAIVGPYTTVTGGRQNEARGEASSVSGGFGNTTLGYYSSVQGGSRNTSSGISSSVSGGMKNLAFGDYASVCGGKINQANGDYSAVVGGDTNKATYSSATVVGGFSNQAGATWSTVTGGRNQTNTTSYGTSP